MSSAASAARRGGVALCAFAALAGCAGPMSMLDVHGPNAAAISQTWWVMLTGAVAIFALVMTLALYAVFRRPEARLPLRGAGLTIAGGVVLPVVSLSALNVYGAWVGDRLRVVPEVPPLQVEVIGNQFWWEARYRGADGVTAVTANEIHIPAGVPVELALSSRDVIHSFWVPNLAGKVDLIPGRTNRLFIRADAPGVYRGQCAEFCGEQHARMALLLVAEPPERFEQWLLAQRAPAAQPRTAAQARGREAFFEQLCHQCHVVRGTRAVEPTVTVGPDLTHVGSRRMIAAGTLVRNEANLTAWIADSQSIKPGNAMPSFEEADRESISDIAAWLEGLK